MVPELLVADIGASRRFWCDLIGFSVLYERQDEGFAYLDLDGAHIMVEQRNEAERQWVSAPLDPPLGRGINLQIDVPSVDAILRRLEAARWPLFMDREDTWYRADAIERGQRQFLVRDPDGYLLRPAQALGERPLKT